MIGNKESNKNQILFLINSLSNQKKKLNIYQVKSYPLKKKQNSSKRMIREVTSNLLMKCIMNLKFSAERITYSQIFFSIQRKVKLLTTTASKKKKDTFMYKNHLEVYPELEVLKISKITEKDLMKRLRNKNRGLNC